MALEKVRELSRTDLLQIVQIAENADQSNRLGRIEKFLRKLVELQEQGADLFKGYRLSVAASAGDQTFQLEQFLIPVKLASVSTAVVAGTMNDADLFTLRIVDEASRPDFIDLPINSVPLGIVEGEFRFRKGHKIDAFSKIQAIWNNATASSKTVLVATAFIRDNDSPLDQAQL